MIERILKQGDFLLAGTVVLIIGLMIMPIPPMGLDLFLSLSITLSIIILLVTAYISRPLEFSVFPSVILIVTLLRLSLNVASTRLILLRGDRGIDAAGKVIKSFGEFVVGGNFVIGFVIFLILITINFVVITKGAGRIAEVSARFILDAMPGKQMSIDADLNSGLIDEDEARLRRKEISQEADFYGAMDGASKFVRGDAIAGIIIVIINIIGGFLIGILQKGMPMAEAAKTYTILTIGDGLVAQMPALITSTAAGIIISRAASEVNLGQEVGRQLFLQPKALGTASGILAFFGILPGLPHIPFLILALTTGTSAYMISRSSAKEEALEPEIEESRPADDYQTLLNVDTLSLEIGYGLIPLVEEEGQLLGRITALRKQVALDMGYIVPPVHIKDNLTLKPTEYSILIQGMEVGRAEIMLNRQLVIMPDPEREKIDGIETKDPTFGLPAVWVEEKDVERARLAGYTVVDSSSVIITHLTEIIKAYSHELLGKQDAQKLLDNLAITHPKVVEDLIPNLLTLGTVHRVLQNLLIEKIPIRGLAGILETLADHAASVKDPEILTEFVRQSLSRWITSQFKASDGALYALPLDPQLEKMINESIQTTAQGTFLDLEPGTTEKLIESIRNAATESSVKGYQPVILCSPGVRRFVRKITERVVNNLHVLSYSELAANTKVTQVGMIRI